MLRSMSTPAELLRHYLPNVESIDDAPRKYGVAFVPDALIRREFFKHIAKDGIVLTESQQARVVVKDRYIISPDLKKIESVLGLHADGIMDLQLQKALDIPQVRDAVRSTLGDAVAAAEHDTPALASEIEVPKVPGRQNPIARG